jgi:hypothetical protein
VTGSLSITRRNEIDVSVAEAGQVGAQLGAQRQVVEQAQDRRERLDVAPSRTA